MGKVYHYNASLTADNGTGVQNMINRFSYPTRPFSDSTFFLLSVLFMVYLHGLTAALGLVTNVINTVVFCRQGFMSHSSVVSLTCLAVADFLSCLFMFMSAITAVFQYHCPWVKWLWNLESFSIGVTIRSYFVANDIACWITAFLSCERAICITLPFKTIGLFTPKRSLVVMASIFIIAMALYVPGVLNTRVIMTVSVNTYLFEIDRRFHVSKKLFDLYIVAQTTIRSLCVLVVVVCNIMILWKMHLSQRLKTSSDSAGVKISAQTQHVTQIEPRSQQTDSCGECSQKGKTSSKGCLEIEIAKPGANSSPTGTHFSRMIGLVSAIFIACNIPHALFSILGYIVFKFGEDYHWWIERVVWYVVVFVQILSASTKFFIYYNMSTSFRKEFTLCFKRKPRCVTL